MQFRIDFKIILVLIIFFITNQIEIYLLFMFFAGIHEIGHLFMGRLLGFKPNKIGIIPMGLSISFDSKYDCLDIKKNAFKKLAVSFAGPVTNLLIAIFFSFINIEIFKNLTTEIIYANFLIAIFNLLPIYPLDGGQIVKNIITILSGLKNSYIYTNLISNITLISLTIISSIAILYLKNIAILFIIIFLWILVIKENIIYNKKMQLYKLVEDM